MSRLSGEDEEDANYRRIKFKRSKSKKNEKIWIKDSEDELSDRNAAFKFFNTALKTRPSKKALFASTNGQQSENDFIEAFVHGFFAGENLPKSIYTRLSFMMAGYLSQIYLNQFKPNLLKKSPSPASLELPIVKKFGYFLLSIKRSKNCSPVLIQKKQKEKSYEKHTI